MRILIGRDWPGYEYPATKHKYKEFLRGRWTVTAPPSSPANIQVIQQRASELERSQWS